MTIANKNQIALFTGEAAYNNGEFHDARCAQINKAVVAQCGKLPCYATPGKRAIKWVSIGSSCVISRGVAKQYLARCGVDIEQVEMAAV